MDKSYHEQSESLLGSLPDPNKIERLFLEERIALLKRLCDEIDPYAPLSGDHQDELRELGIKELYDPFKITNQLLMFLEDSIEELEKLV